MMMLLTLNAPHSKLAFAGMALFSVLAMPTVPALCQAADHTPTGPEARSGTRDLHTYRVTYTVTESEGGKRIAVQRYALTAIPNGRAAVLKQGSRDPVLTGGYLHENAPETTQFQFTYVDTGLNISALLSENGDGLQLAAKVEQSTLVEPVNTQTLKDPSIRQNVIECSSMVKTGVPVTIGGYDVPGSSHRWEIEAVVERVS